MAYEIDRIQIQSFSESDDAFDRAIDCGRLSPLPSAANYAGNYMFMGCNASGVDTFKHCDTRQYID